MRVDEQTIKSAESIGASNPCIGEISGHWTHSQAMEYCYIPLAEGFKRIWEEVEKELIEALINNH